MKFTYRVFKKLLEFRQKDTFWGRDKRVILKELNRVCNIKPTLCLESLATVQEAGPSTIVCRRPGLRLLLQ